MLNRQIKNRHMTRGFAWILTLTLVGCATAPKKGADFIRLMWPEPPLAPRIQFVQVLASERGLGRAATFGETFLEFLTGARPPLWHVYQPVDIAVSDDGQRVYVSDFGQEVIFRFDLERRTVTLIGRKKPLTRPFGVALDGEENLYVVEQGKRQITVLDRQENIVRTITHPRLVRPTDVAIDRARGRIYVADPARKKSKEHTVKVFDLEGRFIGTIGNGKGACKGCLYFPTYVAVDGDGNIYMTSTLNARVDVFDPEGRYLKTIGGRGTVFGMFDKPKGVALDAFGNVYVVDSGWSNVQIFNQKGEVLLFFGGRGTYPGLLKNPTGIAIDKNNRIYVADYLNYRVSVYQLVNTRPEDSFMNPFAGGGGEAKLRAEATERPAQPGTREERR